MTPASGTIIADRFRLVRTLGEGGMGSVWLAQHLKLDVLCAVKLIQADSRGSEEVRRRFEREAKTAAQIRSPHVAHVFDYGKTAEGMPFLVTELLEGQTLTARFQRQGKLPLGEVVSLVWQVSQALGAARKAGVVHRDIKPDNLFLCDVDDVFLPVTRTLSRLLAVNLVGRTRSDEHQGSVMARKGRLRAMVNSVDPYLSSRLKCTRLLVPTSLLSL